MVADVHDLYSRSWVPAMARSVEVRQPVEIRWPGSVAEASPFVCEAAVMIVAVTVTPTVVLTVALTVVLTVVPSVVPSVVLSVVLTVKLAVVVTLSTALQRSTPTRITLQLTKRPASLLPMPAPIGGPHPRLV